MDDDDEVVVSFHSSTPVGSRKATYAYDTVRLVLLLILRLALRLTCHALLRLTTPCHAFLRLNLRLTRLPYALCPRTRIGGVMP